MNATRVSNRAGRRLGMTITAILALMLGLRPIEAAEITATVTGTLNGGGDMLGVFGLRRGMPKGTPYVIVFTFDDTKGMPMKGRCPGGLTGIVGGGKTSPGKAVLTINGKSYEFGNRPDARSQMWRSIETPCSHSSFGMSVQEGHWSQPSGVNVLITPDYGGKSLTQDKNWRDPISLSNFMAKNGDNAIFVRQPGNYAAETISYLSVDIVTVKGGKSLLGLW